MTSERKFIAENIRRVLLKEYLMQKTERAGFGDLDIQRTPLGTRVTLIAERPGMVIGRKGATIKELTKIVEDDFKFDNPQIEVQEAPNPNLNPQIMAQKLVSALERGWHFRRAGHSTVRQIMAAGAKGCQVIISGKLTGQRHRVEKFKEGHIKFCGEPKKQWMHEGFAVAKKKLGIIGVKVQIMDPNAKLPDEVEIIPDDELQALLKSQAEEQAAAAAAEAAEEGAPASAITIKEESEDKAKAEKTDKAKAPKRKREPKGKGKKKKGEEEAPKEEKEEAVEPAEPEKKPEEKPTEPTEPKPEPAPEEAAAAASGIEQVEKPEEVKILEPETKASEPETEPLKQVEDTKESAAVPEIPEPELKPAPAEPEAPASSEAEAKPQASEPESQPAGPAEQAPSEPEKLPVKEKDESKKPEDENKTGDDEEKEK
ncbi:MAG: 30S ribosomal protein S3 [Thermoplasmata archaeon]|nr:MAG: 30S ribosomal protein S3 [Thermoplasmata archaeon]